MRRESNNPGLEIEMIEDASGGLQIHLTVNEAKDAILISSLKNIPSPG